MANLPLLPQPASVRLLGDPLALGSDLQILLAHAHEPLERAAASRIRDALVAIDRAGHIIPQTSTSVRPGDIVLAVSERDDAVFPDALTPPQAAGPEAYRLTIEGGRVIVVGASPAGLVQGVRTLIQVLAATGGAPPALEIDDAPAMHWRGFMLDVSRGAVPTMATLRHLVDTMAHLGLNMLQLYVEHTFAFRSHPAIGRGWGPLQPEQIIQLDACCTEHGIELVPCLQSLGHMRRILDLSEYEHLAFNAEHWSLALGEETYRLLDDLFADYLPCFSSRYVNICCDESFDITGTTAGTHADAAAGGTPHAEVPEGAMRYLAHITRLHEMLARHGKTVMMWDDIFLHWPELLQRVPRDTILLDWYYEAQDSYPQIATVVASGRPAMVCPGTSSWNSLFARVDNARANIRNFVRSGRQAGAFGMLNTDWGDGGHPNLPASSLYGLAYGAAEAWNPGALDDDEFDRRLGIQLAGERSGGAVVRAMRAMGEACTLPRVARVNGSCTWAMFFRDPVPHEVCSTIPDETVARVRELAVEALDLLSDVAPDGIASKETFDELRFAARSIVHAADRTVLGRRIDAHIGGADAELWRAATELKIELHDLRHEFERLWLARYNRGGWWLALDLFDAAAQVEDRWRTTVAPRYQFNA